MLQSQSYISSVHSFRGKPSAELTREAKKDRHTLGCSTQKGGLMMRKKKKKNEKSKKQMKEEKSKER